MKRIILGDIHGNYGDVTSIIVKENPDSVIILGDYCDSFKYNTEDIVKCWKVLTNLKASFERRNKEFVMLIGNHDWHYIQYNERYSGYSNKTWNAMHDMLKTALDEGILKFVYCDETNKTLYSHAGFTETWINEWLKGGHPKDAVNANYMGFNFSCMSFDMYGDSKWQGPLWVRPEALLYDFWKQGAEEGWTQIVGHTRIKEGGALLIGKKFGKEGGDRYKDMKDDPDNAMLWVIDSLPFFYVKETLDESGKLVSRELVNNIIYSEETKDLEIQ